MPLLGGRGYTEVFSVVLKLHLKPHFWHGSEAFELRLYLGLHQTVACSLVQVVFGDDFAVCLQKNHKAQRRSERDCYDSIQ